MRFRIAMGLAAAMILLSPVLALADDSEAVVPDGRVAMYHEQLALPAASNALIWFLFIVLAMLSLAVMFKSARRSHLD